MGVAFTLGFLGSLHCVGMCGPLLIGAMQLNPVGNRLTIWRLIQYTLSKSLAYAVLGLIIGLIGELLYLGSFQKVFSIISGVLLIGMFLFSLNIETLLFKFSSFKKFYNRVYGRLAGLIKKYGNRSIWIIGFLNGFLPCGLVYLALAGALMYNKVWISASFMFIFGLGTVPALVAFGSGYQFIPPTWKRRLRFILPVLQLFIGLLLIYRGLYIDMPKELSFWDAINNPVWCH